MSEIYGLGIAMPMNYKEMIDQLERFGDHWQPMQVTIEAPMMGFKVEVLGNGKMNVSGDVEYNESGGMTSEEIDAALMWAATALIGSLASRGLQVAGMEKIEKGSHVEHKANKFRKIQR